MRQNIEIFKNPFNNRFQKAGVLFLFILEEYIVLEQAIQRIKLLKKQTEKNGIFETLQEDWKRIFQGILGTHREISFELPWHQDVGIFVKLKRLLNQYPHKTSAEKSLISHIYDDLHKARLECAQSYETISKATIKRKTPEIQARFTKLHTASKNLKPFIHSTIKQFYHDENIVLFLLLKREDLTAIYGKGYLKKLLPDLFLLYPQWNRVKEFLVARYQSRGFYAIAKSIEELVKKIQ